LPNPVLQHSVTKDDSSVSVLNFFNSPLFQAPLLKDLPELPGYWSLTRDQVLRQTMFHESNWSNAVSIAISKMASQSWEIKSDTAIKARRAREMFLTANAGAGWVNYIKQHGRDYLTSDNGAFTEVVRQSSAAGSKILGFVHLDSKRCTRTGDPDRPVIYRDRNHTNHELKWYQVFAIADMSDPSSSYNGVGLCAASRAYNTIRKQAIMERFILEKISGARPLSIHFITGVTEKHLNDALSTQESERKARGGVAYGGAVLIPFMQKEGVGHVEVPIASLPENFDREKEFHGTLLVYADSIGLDIQDLMPLSGGPLGTSMQSQVLHDKAAGKGLAMHRQEHSHLINEYVLDDRTTFYYNERDYRDEMQKAGVAGARATFTDTLVQNGTITAPEAKQIHADAGDLPREMLQADLTTSETVNDSDKPVDSNPANDNAPAEPTLKEFAPRQVENFIASSNSEIIRRVVAYAAS
jgi:hypothetical protein